MKLAHDDFKGHCRLADEKWELAVCRYLRRYPAIGLWARMHPRKYGDKTYIDGEISGRALRKYQLDVGRAEADYKCEGTPFFTAHELFGLDPLWTVSYNVDSHASYMDPNSRCRDHSRPCFLVFVVSWNHGREIWKKKDGTVLKVITRMWGFWLASLGEMDAFITKEQPPIHRYKRAGEPGADPRNKKDSYIFDVRTFTELACRYPKKPRLLAGFLLHGSLGIKPKKGLATPFALEQGGFPKGEIGMKEQSELKGTPDTSGSICPACAGKDFGIVREYGLHQITALECLGCGIIGPLEDFAPPTHSDRIDFRDAAVHAERKRFSRSMPMWPGKESK